jgi:hypothetical protein
MLLGELRLWSPNNIILILTTSLEKPHLLLNLGRVIIWKKRKDGLGKGQTDVDLVVSLDDKEKFDDNNSYL